MTENERLARKASGRVLRETALLICQEEAADIEQIIADTYAEAMDKIEAENATLRRQVELAETNTQVTYCEMWDKYRCEFCGACHKVERELVHHPDCPHNHEEASK